MKTIPNDYAAKLNEFISALLEARVEKHIDISLLRFYFWPKEIDELIQLHIATQKEQQETDDMHREIAVEEIIDDINRELPFCYYAREEWQKEYARATPEQKHYF